MSNIHKNILKFGFFSIRLLPHHQDTGAFFVALFRKIDTSNQEELSQKRPAEENTFNEERYIINEFERKI